MGRFDTLPLEIQFKIIKETVKFPLGIQPYKDMDDCNGSQAVGHAPEITSYKRYIESMVDSIKRNLLAHANTAIRRETFGLIFQQNTIEMDIYALQKQGLAPKKKIIVGEILDPKQWVRNLVLRIQLGDEAGQECLWAPLAELLLCPQLETVHLKITWDVQRKKFSNNPETDRFFAIVQARRSLSMCKELKVRLGKGFSAQMMGPRDGQEAIVLAWVWETVSTDMRLKYEQGLATIMETNILVMSYWESRLVPEGI